MQILPLASLAGWLYMYGGGGEGDGGDEGGGEVKGWDTLLLLWCYSTGTSHLNWYSAVLCCYSAAATLLVVLLPSPPTLLTKRIINLFSVVVISRPRILI